MNTFYKKDNRSGLILVNTLVFGAIAIVIIAGLTSWAGSAIKSSRIIALREQAFHIAEAGVDYYRWRLAHYPTDYYDGTGTSTGPHVHDFQDKDGNKIGTYTLTITPPPIGSTIVKILSEGRVDADPSIKRTISVTLAIPSLARYAVVANDVMRFGIGTEIFGPIHSNDGIRFDGIAHNLITSSKDRYEDPDAPGPWRFGVYTQDPPVDPSPPAAVPNRPDIFITGRQFPVQAIDFNGMTSDMSIMKTNAQSNGHYYAASGFQGYEIVLKNNDTYDLYRVNSLVSAPANCTNINNQDGWGTWSINGRTLLGTYNFPNNGIIFVEDHLWVRGIINTARLTIVAARFPDVVSTRRSITVNENLLYTNYDGRDVIALVSQKDINVGLVSNTNLRIDAALIAQNGRVGRFYYRPPVGGQQRCGPNHAKNSITLYGMVGSSKRYGFAYTDGTGYTTRNIVYDGNLLYGPPPSFPLTSNEYSIVSWQEIR